MYIPTVMLAVGQHMYKHEFRTKGYRGVYFDSVHAYKVYSRTTPTDMNNDRYFLECFELQRISKAYQLS